MGEMLRILLKQPESDADRDNTVRVVVGAPRTAPTSSSSSSTATTLPILDVYGMTETGPTTVSRWDSAAPGSMGVPTPWYEVRVLDEDDIEVAAGETGEISSARTGRS